MNTTTVSTAPQPAERRIGLLINRDVGLLWFGQTISVTGDYVFDTTIVLWIASILARGESWAPLAVSGAFIATSIPILLIGPFAGVFVDRWNKRGTMLAADALRAVLALALLPATGLVALPGIALPALPLEWKLGAIYVILFLLNTCGRFFRPATLALFSDLVTTEQQPRAMGLIQTVSSMAMLVGPAVAAPVLVAFGPAWALGLNALSFVVSFATLLAIRVSRGGQTAAAPTMPTMPMARATEAAGTRGGFLREFGAGLRFFVGSRVLMAMAVGASIVMLGGGALNALDVFFTAQNLHAPLSLYGLLATTQGLGMIVGSILASAFAQRIGLVRVLWGGLVLTGAGIVVYSRMTTIGPALAVIFATGIPLAALNVAVGPLLLRATPHALVGRVSALLDPMIVIATIIGGALGGYLDSAVLSHFAVALAGIHFGAVDTIFAAAGLLAILGGVTVALALRGMSAPADAAATSAQPAQAESGKALPEF